MLNPFEKTVALDEEAVKSKKKEFVASMEEAETVFVPCFPELTHRWRCKREGFFVDIDVDFTHGTVLLDVPLGVEVGEEDAAILLAYAKFNEVFKYKTGTFCPMVDDRSIAWKPGAEIHLSFEQLIDSKDIDELVEIAVDEAEDSKEGFVRIVEGCGLVEATAVDDEVRRFLQALHDRF